MAGKRKVPEFLCPIKFRTGLPDHTAACLPPLQLCTMPPLSQSSLVAFGSAAASGDGDDWFEAKSVFDALGEDCKLSDFVDLTVFNSVSNSVPPPTTISNIDKTDHTNNQVQNATTVNNPWTRNLVKSSEPKAKPKSAITSTTPLSVSSTVHSLVAFDHDPHLSPKCILNMSVGDGAGTVILQSDEHKLTEYEARPLGPTEHDYFVVIGEQVYPIGARLQLRRRR